MELWVFKCSKDWRYTGGGLVILAESLPSCQSVLDEYLTDEHEKMDYDWPVELERVLASEDETPPNESMVKRGYPDGKDGDDCWVLVESFAVDGDKPRVVMYDCYCA